MALDKKRSKKDEEMDFNEEESEVDECEKIDLDFEGRKPESHHYNGICTLLHQVFLKLSVNTSELSDWIIKHNDVGTVLQQLEPSDDDSMNEDDDDDIGDDSGLVMSVTTVVNIGNSAESECAKQMRAVLLERCKALPSSEQFEHFLSSADNRVGILINERMIGLPPHTAIYDSLWKDLEKAKKTDPEYDFSHFLLFSKTLRPLVKTSKKKKQDHQSANERLFVNVEEELFFQNSTLNFEFSVKDQCDAALDGTWDDDDDSQCYEPFRTISVVSADKLPEIMSQMASWISPKN